MNWTLVGLIGGAMILIALYIWDQYKKLKKKK